MRMNLRRPNFLGWMNDAVRPKSQKKFVAALNKHLGHAIPYTISVFTCGHCAEAVITKSFFSASQRGISSGISRSRRCEAHH